MKKILIVLLFMFLSSVSVKGIELYDEFLGYYVDGDSVCANTPYYIDNTASYQEITILDAETHTIMEVLNTNATTTELVFPENAGEIIVMTTDYDQAGMLDTSTEESVTLNVESCGYPVVKEDYNSDIPLASFEVTSNNIVVTPPSGYDNYVFTYKFIDHADGKEFDDSADIEIILEENTVIQFTEKYSDEEGKTITNYYELEINSTTNNYFIRSVDSFEISTINSKDLINIKALIAMIVLFLLLMIMRNKHRRLKRKIKKKEETKKGRRR